MLFVWMMDDRAPREAVRQEAIDESLFARIGQGDREAFATLYQLTERALYTYALSILRHPQDAMDVVQDAYLKIRACAHLYQPQGKPLAWMFTIVRNLSVSVLRRGGRDVSAETCQMEDSLQASFISDPTDRLVLATALQRLDEQERQAILLHVVSGLKHREIAENTGAPLATVLSRYHRGLKKLRRYLEEGGAYGK